MRSKTYNLWFERQQGDRISSFVKKIVYYFIIQVRNHQISFSKFAACVGATHILRYKLMFAQTLYFPLSASYEDNLFTSLPSLKRGTSESFSTYSLYILLIYS